MSFRFCVALLLAGLPFAAQAQEAAPIQLDVDHATFAYDGDASLLEVYLSFEAADLPYEASEGVFRARVPVMLALERPSAGADLEPAWSDTLLLQFAVADTANVAAGQQFVHQLRAAVAPGEYELAVTVPAIGGRPALALRRDAAVPDYATDASVRISDVTLSSGIEPSEERDHPFYKNGLLIQPNPNGLFGQGLPRLFYYVETYGAETAIGGAEYTTLVYVADANVSQPLPDLQKRFVRAARTPDVVAGVFDVSDLPSGAYFLSVVVLDEANEGLASQRRKFFVYNPAVERAAPVAFEASYETSVFATMPEDEVELEIDQVRLIAADGEGRRLRALREMDAKRRFLAEFWQTRDPSPESPVNEARDAFKQLVDYANDRYDSRQLEGWETDRGKVLLKYGVPSAIDPHLYERDMAPYEVWEYNNIPGEGRALFVFADRERFGDFRLLHSSVTGEVKEPNWLAVLRAN